MSFDALYKQAEAHSNTRLLKHLIDMYMHQLERDAHAGEVLVRVGAVATFGVDHFFKQKTAYVM